MYILIIFHFLFSYVIGHQIYLLGRCYKLGFEDCRKNPICNWISGSNENMCFELEGQIEARIDSPHHIMVFDSKVNCSDHEFIKKNGFEVTQTFYGKEFSSWCKPFNIRKIEINGNYYDRAGSLPNGRKANGMIVFPNVREGCILLYSKKNFRGDSWEICHTSAIYNIKIRSIMIGKKLKVNFLDREKKLIENLFEIQFLDEGLKNIRPKKTKFIELNFLN